MLWRDARSGELTLIVTSIMVAVLIITSISLFAERLQKALVAEADVFLGAHMVLQSPEEVPADWLGQASHLRQAQTVQFPSMAVVGSTMYLASVKAVSGDYPLVGFLEAADVMDQAGQPATGGPAPGYAWVDNRLLHLLAIKPGDQVTLGERSFTVSKVLTREPDSGSSYWSLGPRVMISLEDLPSTGLVKPGSRVEYRYLFAGDDTSLASYAEFLSARMQKRHKLLTLKDTQPGLAQSLDKAAHFLLLSGSLGVLLASIAIAMAGRRYSIRHYDSIAVMKTFGATPAVIGYQVIAHLGVIVAVGITAGWLAGGLFQHAFLGIMKEWLPANLPEASWRPYMLGALTGFVCTVIFSGPLLWQLRTTPPLRVLRRDMSVSDRTVYVVYLAGAVTIFLLMYLYSSNFAIAAGLWGGTLLCAGVAASLGWFVLGAIEWFGTQAGSIWKLALTNLRRSRTQSILQLVMFGLVIMLLFVSILVRTTIVDEWRMSLPEETPNHFLVNISPWQVEDMEKLFAEQELKTAGLYPMVRGRLTEVNGVEATSIFDESVEAVYRELNLTWAARLPEDNQIVGGSWHGNGTPGTGGELPCVSVENELAKRLNVTLGAVLGFSIAEQKFQAKICSLRELQWDRMRPNFYFIFEPGVLDPYPSTYITSIYLPPDKKLLVNSVVKHFPTVTVLEVDEMLRRMHSMIDQVTRAIETVLAMVLLSGALVLLAGIQASLDQRLHENALIRALGAGRRIIIGSLCLEFVLLGLGAGLMAAFGAELISWVLQAYVFKMPYHFHLWLWWAAPLAGASLIGIVGVGACLRVIRTSPLQILREQS